MSKKNITPKKTAKKAAPSAKKAPTKKAPTKKAVAKTPVKAEPKPVVPKKRGPKTDNVNDVHNHRFYPSDLKQRMYALMLKERPTLMNFNSFINDILTDYYNSRTGKKGK